MLARAPGLLARRRRRVHDHHDGNGADGDACTNACMAAVCGDGILHRGVEMCDDGNSNDVDGCSDCMLGSCGDGLVQPGEACDDANANNEDSCIDEQCDDGNMIDDDLCNNACEYTGIPPCFESNEGVLSGDPWVVCAIDGTQAWVSGNIGGLYQADQICQFLGFTTLAEWHLRQRLRLLREPDQLQQPRRHDLRRQRRGELAAADLHRPLALHELSASARG